jgi:diacylglycerol kinase (CTP)
MNTVYLDSNLKLRSDLHLLRKIWHIGTGLTGLALYYHFKLTPHFMAWILFSLSLIVFSFETLRLRFPAVNQFSMSLMGAFMRECERESYSGLPFYALGTSLSLFFFSEKIAVLSILFLVFADPIASVVGVTYGKDKLISGKSVQGFLGALVTCSLLTFFYGLHYNLIDLTYMVFVLVAGFIGGLSELFSVYVDDNLSIPILAGAGMTILNWAFRVFS